MTHQKNIKGGGKPFKRHHGNQGYRDMESRNAMGNIYFYLKRTYYKNDPRDQLFRNQNKYFALRILSRSRHTFVLIYFFINKYLYCFYNMPYKRRLVTSKLCVRSEKSWSLGKFQTCYRRFTIL